MIDHTELAFIESLVKTKATVGMFLHNGVKLIGTILTQGESVVMLEREGHAQMVYKRAISTITPMPHGALNDR